MIVGSLHAGRSRLGRKRPFYGLGVKCPRFPLAIPLYSAERRLRLSDAKTAKDLQHNTPVQSPFWSGESTDGRNKKVPSMYLPMRGLEWVG